MQRIFKFLMLWFLFWYACPFWILQANVTRFLQAMMTQIFQKQCHTVGKTKGDHRDRERGHNRCSTFNNNLQLLQKSIEHIHFSQCFNFQLPKYFDCFRSVYCLSFASPKKVWMKNYWKFVIYPHGNSCYDQFFGFFFRCGIGCKLQSILLIVWKSILNGNCLKIEQKTQIQYLMEEIVLEIGSG